MATTTTIQEATLHDAALENSERLQEEKEREMATRVDDKPRKSKCNALGRFGAASLVAALGLLGHAVQDMAQLEAEMKIATVTNYVSVPENTVANMTNYIRELEKSNAELQKARDTLKNLLENNPTTETQPYSKEMWLRKALAEAEQGKKEDDSKAVVKSSKARKKGGYFNEHFNLTF